MNTSQNSLEYRPRSLIPVWQGVACCLWLLATASVTRVAAGEERPIPPRQDAKHVFHIDSESGRDTHNGRSAEQAWQSLERVNTADLKPGDTVRFKCGGIWRGSLVPVSGADNAPVTYTSYGTGAKPLILGSRPRDRSEDWVKVRENVWATLPMTYLPGAQVLDLRQSKWTHHQEAEAKVSFTSEDGPAGTTVRIDCENSGRASNHVQVWGPELAVEKGDCLLLTFRARSSKPFRLQRIAIQQGSAPWPVFGVAHVTNPEIGPEWRDYQAVFQMFTSSPTGRVHINLGGILPDGAKLEFQPLTLKSATPSILDPLSVDVGNIIYDHGKACGWKKWSIDELTKPYDYFYDGSSQRVFLCSPKNPATMHESIELALKRHVINQGGARHVTYDGLAVKYGAAHGFGGGNTAHLVIRNCDLSYIGGGHQLTRPDGNPVRYGNAIEFWGAAHDHLVEGCRISEIYDAALTNQGRAPSSRQVNITYRNNVIWNAEYSFEYWNHPESALTENIRFVNNTCVNAGTVWSHAQRPDRNGSHLMFYSNTAPTKRLVVKYNVFSGVTEWGSRYSSGWKELPDMDHNLWFSGSGVMANWFGEKIDGFDDYRKTTGLDANSRSADPGFVDAANGDFRLRPNSPARKIRPDGGPVGADTLW